MPAIPPPPPGFTLDVPPPPEGFKLDSESSVPPPPPGFKLDDEPNFADVVGGSSTAQAPPGLGAQLKQSFVDAGRNIKKVAWDIPTEVLDRPLKPIRESLQQGGITGEMLPDIAKQNFGRFGGGLTAGLERDVAPGLVSGENAAMAGAMAVNPVIGAALLSKFGGEGAKQAIAATQAPPNETPEEKGRRFAQGLGGAAMAVLPLAHAGATPVREAVSRFKEPAARLDLDAVRPEDLGAPEFNAKGAAAVDKVNQTEASLAALDKFNEENPLPPPREPRFAPTPVGPVPGFVDEGVGFDPRIISDFNRWAELRTPNRGEWVRDSFNRPSPEPMFTGIDEPQKFDVSPEKPLEVSPEWLDGLRQGGRAYRGMTADEYEATVLRDGMIKSRGDFSFPEEGTSFSDDPATAESYVNFGRDDPRKTGRPTYLVEASSDALNKWPDGYLKSPDPVKALRAWEMRGDGGRIVASLREIQDAAAGHAENPTDVEIQEVGRRLAELERKAAERQPAEAAPGGDGAGGGAVGSLGEAAGATAERAADPAARGGGLAEAGAPEEGSGGRIAPYATPPASDSKRLPLGQPNLTQASTAEGRDLAGVDPYDGSRFSRSNQGIRDAVAGNEEALIARGKAAKRGEILSDEVQYALKKHADELARNGGDPAEVQRLYDILDESASGKGRQLQALQTAIDNVDHTDPAAVMSLAVKATQGKLSIQAMRDLRDMSVKAKKMKELSAEAINKRAEAALARLEGMGEEVKKLTVKDVLGCP